MRTVLTAIIALVPSLALAAPITFDLRAASIESIDEVNSFSLTVNGLTATLTAMPMTFDGHDLLLNRTSSSFGVNVDGTTCDGAEDSAQLDDGCTAESIQITFDIGVYLNSLFVSSFGSSDEGLATIGATLITIDGTGLHSLGDTFLPAGSPWSIAFVAGNGFSFDNFTADPVPEPATLFLLGTGLVAAGMRRRRMKKRS